MKHIVFLCPGFAVDERDDFTIPPLQLYLRSLARSQRFQLTILSLHFPYRNNLQSWNGLAHYAVFQRGIFSKWRTRWTAWQRLKEIHQERPIDLIHSFWLNDAAWIGEQFSKKNQIPHLVTLMGQDARKSNHFLRFFSLRKMNLVGLSPFHARTFKESTGIEIREIIPWGIEAIASFPERKRNIDILGVGNLIPLKNFGLFLEVIAVLKEDFPSIQAQILGDGVEYNALKARIQALNLEENVQLLGRQPRAFVLEKMQQSKILLHPSEYESYGYVFAEALQNGMSIVSRKVGFAEASQYWQLAEDKDGFVDALRQILMQPRERKSLILHDIDFVRNQYVERYKRLL